jgi:hypothetical protein
MQLLPLPSIWAKRCDPFARRRPGRQGRQLFAILHRIEPRLRQQQHIVRLHIHNTDKSENPRLAIPSNEVRSRDHVDAKDPFVKHANVTALHQLSELLQQIRVKEGIREKKLGIFYRNSKSFLHFHEDPAGLFADLNAGAEVDRYPINSREEWKKLLTAIDRALEP